MRVDIKLTNNKTYKWQKYNNLQVKGVFENQEDIVFKLQKTKTLEDIENVLKEMNPFFSFILKNEDYIYITVDRVSSIPLYYYIDDKKIIILDEPYKHAFSKSDLQKDKVDEFLNCAYVTGKYTMIKNLYRLQAGEILIIDNNKNSFFTKRYYEFRHKDFFKDSELTFDNLYKMYKKVFKRMIKLLDGKTLVVPLSGGYDSRLIVYFLHKLNYKNVICFSYGGKGNWESEISKKVAKYYGFRWIFIEYKREEWYEIYKNEIESYMKFATNFANFAHTQDFLAVKRLKEKGLIPKDSVFIPGHSGDFVAGSHIPNNIYYANSKEYIVDTLLKKHYSLQKLTLKGRQQLFKENILNLIKEKDNYISEGLANEIEYWDWQERQVKYIINSIKVYEYFGYKWYLPLWDREVMDFWLRVPLKHRLNRNFYIKFAKSIHGKIEANPKINIFQRVYEKYCSEWYGRLIRGDCLKIFLIKLEDIFRIDLPSYIDRNKRLYEFNRVGVNTIKMYESILRVIK